MGEKNIVLTWTQRIDLYIGREDSLYLNNDGNWDEEKFLVREIKTFRLTF